MLLLDDSLPVHVLKIPRIALPLGLLLVALMWPSAADAHHSWGAKYTGTTASGGTVTFQTSADGSAVTSFGVTDVPTSCGTVSVSATGTYPINDASTPAFSYGTATTLGMRFSGSFPSDQHAGGLVSFRFYIYPSYCTTADISWTATTPTPPPAKPPVLSGLNVSPSKFTLTGRLVNGRCVAVTLSNRNKPKCTRRIALRITHTLNIRARVTFTLKKKLPGRLVNGRCVAVTSSNRSKPKCVRWSTVSGSLSRTGNPGTNSFTFDGWIGGHKIGVGTYRLRATPVANGLTGAAKTTTFQVAR